MRKEKGTRGNKAVRPYIHSHLIETKKEKLTSNAKCQKHPKQAISVISSNSQQQRRDNYLTNQWLAPLPPLLKP